MASTAILDSLEGVARCYSPVPRRKGAALLISIEAISFRRRRGPEDWNSVYYVGITAVLSGKIRYELLLQYIDGSPARDTADWSRAALLF